jgi:arginase family enzyme
MALWLLTEASPFRDGVPVPPANVHVVGHSNPPERPESGIRTIPLAEVRNLGVRNTAERVLSTIPSDATVLLHFDVDVLHLDDMPAMYFPHSDGLTMEQGRSLFEAFARDRRVRLIEVSEYASMRDFDRRAARALTDMIVQGLRPS